MDISLGINMAQWHKQRYHLITYTVYLKSEKFYLPLSYLYIAGMDMQNHHPLRL